jgi:hypothetical protein
VLGTEIVHGATLTAATATAPRPPARNGKKKAHAEAA